MKRLLTIALIALSGYALPSCGDDDEAKKQDPTPTPAALEGTWYNNSTVITAYNANWQQVGNPKTETHSGSDRVARTFTAPSTFSEKLPSGTVNSGSYIRVNNRLTITTNQSVRTHDIDSLTATRLVYRDTIPGPSGTQSIIIIKSVR